MQVSELIKDLNKYMEERIKNEDRFVIDDESKADWALRKIKEHQQKIDEAKKLAEKEKEKIDEWFNDIKIKKERQINNLESLLAEYAMQKRKEDKNFKTMKLPNGRFGFRKQPLKWKYDNEKVVETLEKLGMTDLVRIKKEPKKSDIKKVFEVVNGKAVNPETGEVVEGIEVINQGESFGWRVNDE